MSLGSEFFKNEKTNGFYRLLPSVANKGTFKLGLEAEREIIEFLNDVLECDDKFSVTVLFNNKCPRCSICANLLNTFSKDTCSSVCRNIKRKQTLHSDPEKYKSFVDKITKIGKRRGESMTPEQKQAWADIGRKYIQSIPKEELKARQSYNKSGNIEFLQNWRENVSEEELLQMYNRRAKTLRQREYDLSDYKNYSRRVRYASELVYAENIQTINPDNLQRGNSDGLYHLDHIVSILECFVNDISVEVASSVFNLRMLSNKENLRKGAKSDKTLEQLIEEYSNGVR